MVVPDFYIDAPRLVLSHLDASQDDHCDFLVALKNTEQSRKHNSLGKPMEDREVARETILADERRWTDGYGRYLVSLKPSPKTSTAPEPENAAPFSERVKSYTKLGVVTMKFRRFEGAPLAPDVGYGFMPEFQGKGYATEAAAALVRWFEEKGQKEFFGFCGEDNVASIGVLRRLGFKDWGPHDIAGLKPNGETIRGMVFSKGLTMELGAYGIR